MSIKELIDEIRKASLVDVDKETKLIKELKKQIKKDTLADKEELKYAKIFADTYTCHAYLRMGKINQALSVGSRVSKVQIRENLDDLRVFTYNLLGYICGCMENYVSAATYFYEGIEVAQKMKEYNTLYILYTNFAEIYLRFEEFEKAKELYEKGYLAIKNLGWPEEKMKRAKRIYNDKRSLYYFGVGEYDKAIKYATNDENREVMIARVARMQNDVERANKALSNIFSLASRKNDYIEQFERMKYIFDTVLFVDNKEFVQRALDKLHASAKHCNLANYWVYYYECLIRASEKYGWEISDDLYSEFYKHHQEFSKQLTQNEKIGINIEFEIFNGRRKQLELKKKNEKLKQKSMLDNLTKIYNRAGFSENIINMLEQAKIKGSRLGICIIDVDDFKNINDSYGHLMGDKCLKKVAGILSKAFLTDAAVCRYGGDEFVVITLDYSDEELENILKNIMKKKTLKPVTLSIGAVNCIPNSDSTDVDYLYTADKLLYAVKNEGKNNYMFATALK